MRRESQHSAPTANPLRGRPTPPWPHCHPHSALSLQHLSPSSRSCAVSDLAGKRELVLRRWWLSPAVTGHSQHTEGKKGHPGQLGPWQTGPPSPLGTTPPPPTPWVCASSVSFRVPGCSSSRRPSQPTSLSLSSHLRLAWDTQVNTPDWERHPTLRTRAEPQEEGMRTSQIPMSGSEERSQLAPSLSDTEAESTLFATDAFASLQCRCRRPSFPVSLSLVSALPPLQ